MITHRMSRNITRISKYAISLTRYISFAFVYGVEVGNVVEYYSKPSQDTLYNRAYHSHKSNILVC